MEGDESVCLLQGTSYLHSFHWVGSGWNFLFIHFCSRVQNIAISPPILQASDLPELLFLGDWRPLGISWKVNREVSATGSVCGNYPIQSISRKLSVGPICCLFNIWHDLEKMDAELWESPWKRDGGAKLRCSMRFHHLALLLFLPPLKLSTMWYSDLDIKR